MKLYLVERNNPDWDEFDSIVVKAETLQRAREIALDFHSYFNDSRIKEIHLDDIEEIAHKSFMSG